LEVRNKNGGTGFQPVQEFRLYRRKLPHWEDPGYIYFITFRTFKHFILPEKARQIILDSCRFHDNKKYELYACVVMPEHVHLILQPLEKTDGGYYSIAEIMHSLKSYSANQINKLLRGTGKMPVAPGKGEAPGRDVQPGKNVSAGKVEQSKVWLDESFDRIIRDEKELLEKMNYIATNPIKTGLVEKLENYKWLIVKGWIE